MKMELNQRFYSWGGGIDFIRHVASAIDFADQHNEYEKHLLIAKNDWLYSFKRLIYPFRTLGCALRDRKPLQWQTWPGFDEIYLRNTFCDLKSYFLDAPGHSFRSHLDFCRTNKFDVVLPCISPPPRSYNYPWVGYLYDFQHKYLPEFFTDSQIASRDIEFSAMLRSAKHVIVNSHAVKLDAIKFIPHFNAKIHVLPFSPAPSLAWLSDNRDLSRK